MSTSAPRDGCPPPCPLVVNQPSGGLGPVTQISGQLSLDFSTNLVRRPDIQADNDTEGTVMAAIRELYEEDVENTPEQPEPKKDDEESSRRESNSEDNTTETLSKPKDGAQGDSEPITTVEGAVGGATITEVVTGSTDSVSHNNSGKTNETNLTEFPPENTGTGAIPKTFECNDCADQFTTLNQLRMHIKASHRESSDSAVRQGELCESCGYKSTSINDMNCHKSRKHTTDDMSAKPSTRTVIAIEACENCSSKESDIDLLNEHIAESDDLIEALKQKIRDSNKENQKVKQSMRRKPRK